MLRRRFADLLLFCVTSTELVILFLLTPTFGIADWIYVLQHVVVLGIALARPHPRVRDYSMPSSHRGRRQLCLSLCPGYLFALVTWRGGVARRRSRPGNLGGWFEFP